MCVCGGGGGGVCFPRAPLIFGLNIRYPVDCKALYPLNDNYCWYRLFFSWLIWGRDYLTIFIGCGFSESGMVHSVFLMVVYKMGSLVKSSTACFNGLCGGGGGGCVWAGKGAVEGGGVKGPWSGEKWIVWDCISCVLKAWVILKAGPACGLASTTFLFLSSGEDKQWSNLSCEQRAH